MGAQVCAGRGVGLGRGVGRPRLGAVVRGAGEGVAGGQPGPHVGGGGVCLHGRGLHVGRGAGAGGVALHALDGEPGTAGFREPRRVGAGA